MYPIIVTGCRRSWLVVFFANKLRECERFIEIRGLGVVGAKRQFLVGVEGGPVEFCRETCQVAAGRWWVSVPLWSAMLGLRRVNYVGLIGAKYVDQCGG